MSRRPATFTKADLARALAVAQEAGPDYAVKVTRDGALEIYRKANNKSEPLDAQWDFRL